MCLSIEGRIKAFVYLWALATVVTGSFHLFTAFISMLNQFIANGSSISLFKRQDHTTIFLNTYFRQL